MIEYLLILYAINTKQPVTQARVYPTEETCKNAGKAMTLNRPDTRFECQSRER